MKRSSFESLWRVSLIVASSRREKLRLMNSRSDLETVQQHIKLRPGDLATNDNGPVHRHDSVNLAAAGHTHRATFSCPNQGATRKSGGGAETPPYHCGLIRAVHGTHHSRFSHRAGTHPGRFSRESRAILVGSAP